MPRNSVYTNSFARTIGISLGDNSTIQHVMSSHVLGYTFVRYALAAIYACARITCDSDLGDNPADTGYDDGEYSNYIDTEDQ